MELSSDFRLIRWDMRGHARSSSPDDARAYSKQAQVDDMNAILDTCGVSRAVFVGHSMGAYDTLLYYMSSAVRSAHSNGLLFKPQCRHRQACSGEQETCDGAGAVWHRPRVFKAFREGAMEPSRRTSGTRV
jgi:hypothetical protein